MEITISDILSIAGWLLGGGSIGGVLTWRFTRRKEKAEAEQAETTAAKEVQDVYQQLIADVKQDRNEQKSYIEELKADRLHLRADRDELRGRLDKTDEMVRNLQSQVARNGRKVDAMTPFLCARLDCADRIRATVSADGDVKPKRANPVGES